MKTSAIFSPIQLGDNLLRHRVVMAPLTRFRASADAVPSDLQVEYYQQRCSKGGLIIAEATFIDRLAGGLPHVPGIYNQAQIEGWQKVTTAVHAKEGIIFLQLWHLGRTGSKDLNPDGEQTVSASSIASDGKTFLGAGFETPRALETEEIGAIVEQYRSAAVNAIEAGFDGVEIHGGSGYLLDQFINSNSNVRTDIYGGSIENRCRIVFDVLDAIVGALGAERVAIRFSPGGDFQDMHDATPVETWSYLTSEIQKRYPRLGYLHFIEVCANFFIDTDVPAADSIEPYRKIWKGPLVMASGFSTTHQHAIELAERTGNLIAFGRAFIANPDLPERLSNGWELEKHDRDTFYSSGSKGYTDYSCYKDAN
ncbi:hypothetical protein INT47_006266 [Mucor saturninus]|uniref:NADH:flavin oxidoreductase/NADH oxidase N-terminal domain-containing protein n=1 Tax=Mucor saturninus TaxID=64648 RepID=A0A8H7VA42_9FUNG|nr:hypothetical protein INT47_006266 [Mucor saturninus]